LLFIVFFAIFETFALLLAITFAIEFALFFSFLRYLLVIAIKANSKMAINYPYFFLAKVYVPKIPEQ
jgi:hypothetical protein